MEKINNYIYDNNNNYKEFERKQLEMNLPISNPSGQDYLGLLKINDVYIQQLTKIFSENPKKNATLPFHDMVVINSLLKENLNYLYLLFQYQNFQYEFDDLYNKSIQILNFSLLLFYYYLLSLKLHKPHHRFLHQPFSQIYFPIPSI